MKKARPRAAAMDESEARVMVREAVYAHTSSVISTSENSRYEASSSR